MTRVPTCLWRIVISPMIPRDSPSRYDSAMRNLFVLCEFKYGRPMKGHGWQPTSTANLVRWMAEHIVKNSPPGENAAAWHY